MVDANLNFLSLSKISGEGNEVCDNRFMLLFDGYHEFFNFLKRFNLIEFVRNYHYFFGVLLNCLSVFYFLCCWFCVIFI